MRVCLHVFSCPYWDTLNAHQPVQSGDKASEYDDYVDKKEFRLFLQYLRQYLELWVMFEKIDTSKDKRIEPKEFVAAASMVVAWGLPKDKIADPAKTFKEIDVDNGGFILFDEFADWAIKQKLDLEDDGIVVELV